MRRDIRVTWHTPTPPPPPLNNGGHLGMGNDHMGGIELSIWNWFGRLGDGASVRIKIVSFTFWYLIIIVIYYSIGFCGEILYHPGKSFRLLRNFRGRNENLYCIKLTFRLFENVPGRNESYIIKWENRFIQPSFRYQEDFTLKTQLMCLQYSNFTEKQMQEKTNAFVSRYLSSKEKNVLNNPSFFC